MSDINTRRGLLAAVVLTALLISAPLTAGVATADQQPPTRTADLAVRQPAYIDADVRTTNANGTPVYVVRGEEITLKPRNFDADDVVEFGVETDVGTLAYDSPMEVFRFRPGNNTGTFRVYWLVAEPVTEEVTQNNTTTTVTTTRQVRYEAIIKIAGGTNVAHLPGTDAASLRDAAGKWDAVTAVVDESLTVEQIAAAVKLRYAPAAYLTGRFTRILTLMVISFGGWLILALYYGSATWPIYKLRRQVNEFRTVENVEGDLAERQARLDSQERDQLFARVDFEDWFSLTDASELRDVAETPQGLWRLLIDDGPIAPATLYQWALQAMGQCGWTAVVERDAEGDITAAELVQESDVDADAETVALDDRRQVAAVIPHVHDDRALVKFDLVGADYDDAALDLPLYEPTPEGVVEAIDGWEVTDEREAAHLLRSFVERVADHPYTDRDGRPDTAQEVLNELLDLSYRVRDEVGVPNAALAADLLERAIQNADPNDRARSRVREVRDGVSGD